MLKRCAIAGGVAAAIVASIIVTLPCVVLIFGGATVWGAQNIEAVKGMGLFMMIFGISMVSFLVIGITVLAVGGAIFGIWFMCTVASGMGGIH
jgi:hypothetical protein